MSAWRQLRAIGPLPVMASIVVPALILWLADDVDVGWGVVPGAGLERAALAAAATALGAALAEQRR